MPLPTDYETNDPNPAAALDLTNTEVNALRTLVTALNARALSDIIPPRPEVGAFIDGRNISTGQLASFTTGNTMYLTRVVVAVPTNVDQIGTHIKAVGTGSGQSIRMGIYNDDGTGTRPGTLRLDAGTITTLTGTGLKTIAISQALAVGVYWLAWVLQGTLTTGPTIVTSTLVNQVASLDLDNTSQRQWVQSGVSGALPAIGTLARGSTCPIIGLRVAS